MENHREVTFLDDHMENYNLEASAMHRKLQSKVEALKIMRKELEKYRTERDQFKLMAETIQLRYSAIKKSLIGCEYDIHFEKGSSVAALVNDTQERNIALMTEVETLRQKLYELQGDIQELRRKNSELSDLQKMYLSKGDAGNDKQAEWNLEKANLIAQMESLKKMKAQLQYDFRSLLDEKEEIVTERDAYKCKVHRLNYELNVMLNGGQTQKTVLDLDAIVLENKYLHDRLQNLEQELDMAKQSTTKYKSMLETKRKKGIVKLGTNNSDIIMSHKQAKLLVEKGTSSELPVKETTISDLKSLCLALLDNLNDKNIALMHQKKTNKLLATRITELEKRLQIACGINAGGSVMSPSQLLLDGYSYSSVDDDLKVGKKVTEDEIKNTDKDLSSNDEDACHESDTSSEYTLSNYQSDSFSHKDSNFDELPPEIADMVKNSLKEFRLQEERKEHSNE